MSNTTFAYWGFRGIAQPIRYLLAHLQVEHNSKVYETGEEWFGQDKKNLGLDFPNLPYLIDGENKITESSAIPIYLIKKAHRLDLLGQSPDGSFVLKEVRVQQLIGYFRDVFKELIEKVCSQPNIEQIKERVLQEKLQPMLDRVITWLGNNDYLMEALTYADFIFYELLCYFKCLYPQTITPTLQAYMERFENIPGIKEYLKQPDVNLNVFLPTVCTWNGPK